MSRTRPPKLEKWSRLLNSSSSSLTPAARPSLLPQIDHHDLARPRLFQTTSPNAAQPAPSTRRRAAQGNATRGASFPGQQLLKDLPNNPPPQNDSLNARLHSFEKNAFRLTSEMLHDEIIDKSITPKKVKRVGTALLKNASGYAPSPGVINRIAQNEGIDVDTIFEIGRAITRTQGDKELNKWITTSCMVAGVRMAVLISAATQLRGCHDCFSVYEANETREPTLSTALAQIKALATRPAGDIGQDNRDPQAMIIYAKYLGLRREYLQGIFLLHEALQFMEPSQSQPRPDKNIAASWSFLEPPWELLLWLQREEGKQKRQNSNKAIKTEEYTPDHIAAIRLGAEQYQDPNALIRLAQYEGHTTGVSQYEKYMGQAAASGHRHACRKLANLYYLVSTGHYPRPGTQATNSVKLRKNLSRLEMKVDLEGSRKPKGRLAALLSFFQLRPVHEYRSLAMEWYRVSWAQGCWHSGINLSLLYLQEGNTEEAKNLLQEVEERSAPMGPTPNQPHYQKSRRLLETIELGDVESIDIHPLDW
ncbi:hypothetical protein BDW62DRAFT_199324 [Aspergillus aurantiobrunneus]